MRVEAAADGTAALSAAALDKLEEPPSLVALRAAVQTRMPRVDLPELLMEMHARTSFAGESTHASGRGTRADELCPRASAPCCWPRPAAPASSLWSELDAPALRRSRLSGVRRNYLRAGPLKRRAL